MKNPSSQSGLGEPNGGELPRTFTRRLILLVNLVFLVTMAIFLAISFVSERALHYQATFAHLEETLGVISMMPEISPTASPTVIRDLESRLGEHTGVPHRLFVVAEGKISASSEENLLGRAYGSVVNLRPFEEENAHRGIAQIEGTEWLVSFRTGEDSGFYLMRSRGANEGFASRFMALHGIHLMLTVLAFVVLLKFLMDRYVRRPIEQLARHVHRVEKGEFQTASQVSGEDEVAWLARRFTRMGTELKTTVERLVRSEKYSAVTAVTFRVARELKAPLERMDRHILELESVAQQQPDLRRLAGQMRSDRESLIDGIRHLREIEPPEGV